MIWDDAFGEAELLTTIPWDLGDIVGILEELVPTCCWVGGAGAVGICDVDAAVAVGGGAGANGCCCGSGAGGGGGG